MDAVAVLLGLFIVPIGILLTTAVAVLSRLRRSNRVAPGSPIGGAPLTWLWSPGWAATLHRRLRAACALAASVAGPPTGRRRRRKGPLVADSIAELAQEVVSEAVRLDRALVTAALTAPGPARAQVMSALDYEVRGIEDAAQRVHRLAAQRAQLASSGIKALTLNERIASLEAAMSELNPGPRPLS